MYGSKTFKVLLFLQIEAKHFWNLSWLFLPMILTKKRVEIFEILSFPFLTIFFENFNSPL